MILKQAPMEEAVINPATGEKVEKTMFVVFFAGEHAKTKVVCEVEEMAADPCFCGATGLLLLLF
jgi:V-type H+-transporting ATPase subunit a